MIVEDLTPLYADFGRTVTRADDSTFTGLLNAPSAEALDVRAGQNVLRFVTADASDMSEGEVVTIAGTSYTVAEPPQRINDGSESIVGLYR